jgi:hypothetical protein
VRACSIRLLDKTGARLNVAAVYGLSDAYVKKGDLVLEQNPLAREVIAGKTIIVNDVATDTRLQYPQEALAEGIVFAGDRWRSCGVPACGEWQIG